MNDPNLSVSHSISCSDELAFFHRFLEKSHDRCVTFLSCRVDRRAPVMALMFRVYAMSQKELHRIYIPFDDCMPESRHCQIRGRYPIHISTEMQQHLREIVAVAIYGKLQCRQELHTNGVEVGVNMATRQQTLEDFGG